MKPVNKTVDEDVESSEVMVNITNTQIPKIKLVCSGSRSSVYVGCFVDTYTRVLPHQYELNGSDHPDMENNRCLLYCKDQGYKYAGTQKKAECYCGDDPYQYVAASISDYYLMEYDCNQECLGDSNQICGGGWRLSVYETGFVPLEQAQTRYTLLFSNKILTAPANQILISRNILECARYCSTSVNCKVFVTSTETGHCSLYNSFEIVCEGIEHIQDFKVYLME
ncbi:unnamed protein product [Mytilus coruscus]|uniref:WSC domain-containing protein n=1 Tax=Mytilus coruscus TaxID=42192 RepID=A0A6J8C7W3_MYTCO|nr:unnamed protein product [Mytilus coruscus]